MDYYPCRLLMIFFKRYFTLIVRPTLTIDVDKQTITIDATGEQEKFDINAYKKTCLLNGYDDIDYLINNKKEIEAFEATLFESPFL